MAIRKTLILAVTFLLLIQNCYGQAKLDSDLSLLFGNLPMNLPVKKIIASAEGNKNFKGQSHYNLDQSYSGIVFKSNFFKLKPNTCFIEIVANGEEVFLDSDLSDFSLFSFDAGFNKADSNEIKAEFERIVKVFSTDFTSGKIEKTNEQVYFYKSKSENKPTLNLSINQSNSCYSGGTCIKLVYFRFYKNQE